MPILVYDDFISKSINLFLGNRSSTSFAGLLKIKLRAAGLRIVYQLRRTENEMLTVVIGIRADEEVYDLAQKRADRHGLLN